MEESEDAPVEEQAEAKLFEEKEEKKPSGPAAWGYILPSGKLWIRLEFAEAGQFLDGRAAVRPSGEGTPWCSSTAKEK